MLVGNAQAVDYFTRRTPGFLPRTPRSAVKSPCVYGLARFSGHGRLVLTGVRPDYGGDKQGRSVRVANSSTSDTGSGAASTYTTSSAVPKGNGFHDGFTPANAGTGAVPLADIPPATPLAALSSPPYKSEDGNVAPATTPTTPAASTDRQPDASSAPARTPPSTPQASAVQSSSTLPAAPEQPPPPMSALAALSSKAWWRKVPWTKVWGLALLSVSYVHQATTGFSVPAMLPIISSELGLNDFQGAFLTTGYSYLYAVALVPVGLLADRMSRPKLLAGGLALWSFLTCTASGARSFQDLMLARVGFAAAQSTQNPICFGLIPEMFPRHKSTALALYNCAIYVGRALSFWAALLARHLNDVPLDASDKVSVKMVPMDSLDLHSMSIVYTSGDMAAVTPVYDYNFNVVEYGSQLPDSSWRQVLRWIAIPGFLIALACLLTLPEPREAKIRDADPPTTLGASSSATAAAATARSESAGTSGSLGPAVVRGGGDIGGGVVVAGTSGGGAAALAAVPTAPAVGGTWASVLKLLQSPSFMATTFAAAMNDVGSYALIAWQSTFYERVYHLEPSMYAPILALLLPVGGIIGGVGGGALADYLSKRGGRVWITGGASVLCVPFIAESLLAGGYQESFMALLVAFALSEAWRAPAAVMARSTAPASLGSTSSALYLCIRNLVGGLGPLGVAVLAESVGLQRAMLLVPAAYLMSGLMFVVAEYLFERETMQQGICNI